MMNDPIDNLASKQFSTSASYGTPCPQCGAGANDPCRNERGKVTSTHLVRINTEKPQQSAGTKAQKSLTPEVLAEWRREAVKALGSPYAPNSYLFASRIMDLVDALLDLHIAVERETGAE